MRLRSNLHQLQRAKLQNTRNFVQAEQKSSIDVFSLSIVIIAHLAVITFFVVNFSAEPPLTLAKPRILQVSLQATKPNEAAPTALPEDAASAQKALISTDAASVETSHATPTPDLHLPPTAPTAPTAPSALSPEEQPAIRNYQTHYFKRAELSEKAQVIDDVANEIALDIPTSEPQNLVLLLFINEEGGIDKVELLQANLPEEAAQIVKTNFMRIKFSPGKIDGVAVKSQLSIEVRLEGNSLPPVKLGGAK